MCDAAEHPDKTIERLQSYANQEHQDAKELQQVIKDCYDIIGIDWSEPPGQVVDVVLRRFPDQLRAIIKSLESALSRERERVKERDDAWGELPQSTDRNLKLAYHIKQLMKRLADAENDAKRERERRQGAEKERDWNRGAYLKEVRRRQDLSMGNMSHRMELTVVQVSEVEHGLLRLTPEQERVWIGVQNLSIDAAMAAQSAAGNVTGEEHNGEGGNAT